MIRGLRKGAADQELLLQSGERLQPALVVSGHRDRTRKIFALFSDCCVSLFYNAINAALLQEMGWARSYLVSGPLIIEDVALEAPGLGELLLRIKATGLCHSDLSVINQVALVVCLASQRILRESWPKEFFWFSQSCPGL